MCCPPGVGCNASVVPCGVTDTATAPVGTRMSPFPPTERLALGSEPNGCTLEGAEGSIEKEGVRFRLVAPTDSRRVEEGGASTGDAGTVVQPVKA